jgi:2-polyprenyl-3-methyl-5-hydroxy-6-metoxy-1,4-benzoquinol methylase
MKAPLQPVRGPTLRPADRAIRWVRIRQARRHVTAGSRVLDIGCGDGSLFASLGERISGGVGIDPGLAAPSDDGRFRFIADGFPTVALDEEQFDVITMLAVLEHVPDDELPAWAEACARLLTRDGVIVATMPEPRVDDLLHLLMRMHLVAGMAAHEHHGADPKALRTVFAGQRLEILEHRRFELGLNNLFVFGRSDEL